MFILFMNNSNNYILCFNVNLIVCLLQFPLTFFKQLLLYNKEK
jgi:hypothetical protein